jgi:hypothetical protein
MNALRPLALALLFVTSLAAVSLPPMHADAQPVDAAKAFADGRTAFEARDFASALPSFQRAVEATGSPNARLYYARCLREVGRIVEAYDQMEQTVREARTAAESDERYAVTRDSAAAELALLEARVGRLVIVLGPGLEGTSLSVAGAPLDVDRVGRPVTVLPGKVTVTASDARGLRASADASVQAGSVTSLTLTPSADAPAEKPTLVPSKPASDDGAGFGVVRGLGIGVAALGVGGIVLFAVGTVQADDALATLETRCPTGCTDPEDLATLDDGKAAEVMANVGLGIGIAGVVAGTLMMIFGGPSDAAPAGAAESALFLGPRGVGVRF